MSCQGVGSSSSATNIASCPQPTAARASGGEASRELLPGPFAELGNNSDIGAKIAALIVNASREQKESARSAREHAEVAQRAADDKELEAMHDEATWKCAAGVIEGGATAVSGGIGVVTASAGGVAEKTWKGITTGIEGSGKGSGAVAGLVANRSAEDVKKWEQTSGREKRAVDDARDLDKDAKEMLNRALSYYKEYLTAKNDAQRATLLKA